MAAATHDQIIDGLNYCLNKLGSSTAQYILSATPYTTDADKNAMGAIKEMAGTERELATECLALIENLEGIPSAGVANPLFAELNYLSFPYLLDILIRETEAEIPQFQKLLPGAESEPGMKPLLEKAIQARTQQLKKLKDIREKSYKTE